ncbi:hypothetical protein FA95DRAFT_1678842 [Auriscalpium vulgare]|uniref:Uncharacterized protein n=1 Tax=Auriscalpium vulgare TaxID=40419 RepID=A0ACB8RV37_9AGAM|nr:hypothetical protein FA95DRAFT_1678842 [Auriscalpium vulgare]
MPVATRSTTGKLPSKRPLQPDDDENTGEHTDDDGGFSDAFSRASSEAREPRPAKRAKNNKGKQVAKGPTRGKRGLLSALPSMPLDILFEIFGCLPPADLIHLTRVTKAFRQLLLSRDSMLLWRESYKLVPDVPSCPGDMSEPAWANLLFGGAHCHTCDYKPVTRILFVLRRRVCRPCMSLKLIEQHTVASRFPLLTPDEAMVLPSVTGRECGTKGRGCDWFPEYWIDDLQELQDEIEHLLKKHEDQSEAYMAEWKERSATRQAALAVKIKACALFMCLYVHPDISRQHAGLCADWERRKAAARSDELYALKAQRYSDIAERFAALGYPEQDVASIRRHRDVTAAKPLSDRVWTRIFPILEPLVANANEMRLLREFDSRAAARKAYVQVAYRKYLQTLPIRTTSFAPHALECLSQPLVLEAIKEDEPVTPEFKERLDELIATVAPEMLASVCTRANTLIALLPEVKSSKDAIPVVTHDILFCNTFPAGPAFGLGLAAKRFLCRNCDEKLDGFRMLTHKCLGFEADQADYDALSHATVLELLGLLGLDFRTATADELDRRDAHFVCMGCKPTSRWCGFSFVTGRYGLGWRSCLSHVHDAHNGRFPSQWKLLDPEQTAIVKTREAAEVYERAVWGCGHCYIHLEEGKTWLAKPHALKHVQDKHGVEEPVVGIDYWRNLSDIEFSAGGMIEMEDFVDSDAAGPSTA